MRLERLVPAFGGLILIIRATWGFGCRINGMFWIRRYFSGESSCFDLGCEIRTIQALRSLVWQL